MSCYSRLCLLLDPYLDTSSTSWICKSFCLLNAFGVHFGWGLSLFRTCTTMRLERTLETSMINNRLCLGWIAIWIMTRRVWVRRLRCPTFDHVVRQGVVLQYCHHLIKWKTLLLEVTDVKLDLLTTSEVVRAIHLQLRCFRCIQMGGLGFLLTPWFLKLGLLGR